MGIQAMASQGGGGQQSQIQSLTRQGSIYNLTLNEVQNHLGEPLHSMNLDELLKNVWSADAGQSLTMDPEGASAHQFHHQGSITMTRALSKKTVDEVWREIHRSPKKGNEDRRSGRESHPTLGEMTLEDFLVKAGVVAEGADKRRSDPVGNVGPTAGPQGFAQGAHWLQQYHQMQQEQQAQQSMMGGYVYPEGNMSISPPLVGTTPDPETPGRRQRGAENVVERTVERRQKRMIKNRESAARSRARKQAYTNELENKVSRLEEENERLKKQKKLETILRYVPPPAPKFQLRRSSSAPL